MSRLVNMKKLIVSTHSRLKAAGQPCPKLPKLEGGFNTQPPEGGWVDGIGRQAVFCVSTHSRLKAAGRLFSRLRGNITVSTHSRLKAAGTAADTPLSRVWFQHTAA